MLCDNLPTIIESVISAIVELLPALIDGLIQLVLGIVEALPEIIVAIIDITILPAEEVVDPPLKLDVTYTNTSNQVVTRTFDVPVNFLLNGNSDNYDIMDEDGIIKGTVELTDVKTGTDVDFMFYYDSVYRPELTNVKTLIQRVT